MLCNIEFISGYLTNRSYKYKAKNKLKPFFLNSGKEPLYLSDFKSLETIYQPSVGRSLVKCTFENGKESLALVHSALLKTLYIYLYNKNNNEDKKEIVIPNLYRDIPWGWIILISMLGLYLYAYMSDFFVRLFYA